MVYLKSLEESLPLFKALGSRLRIDILKALLLQRNMNVNELAAYLNVSVSSISAQIHTLADCGLIMIHNLPGKRGSQKQCTLMPGKLLVDLNLKPDLKNVYQTEIKIGHYTDFQVLPTCGLSAADHLIGKIDHPRYFAHPDRYNADILWFTQGYVEYLVPNLIPEHHLIEELTFTLELGSEAPGSDSIWPSDISFYLNRVKIASYISPGDFSDMRGLFSPDWWPKCWNQYGFLKTLTINRRGTYLDGLPVSEQTISSFNLDSYSMIRLKLAVEEDVTHVGGLTIFGNMFGNYNQGILASIRYTTPMQQ